MKPIPLFPLILAVVTLFSALPLPAEESVEQLIGDRTPFFTVPTAAREINAYGQRDGVSMDVTSTPDRGAVLKFQTARQTGAPRAVAFQMLASQPVNEGDVILVSFDLQSPASSFESGAGEMTLIVGQQDGKWHTFSTQSLTAGRDWKNVTLWCRPNISLQSGQTRIAWLVGGWPQTIEVTNFRSANLGKDISENRLPIFEADVDYPGRALDASWRKAANERIREHRKAPLSITVTDKDGTPLAGVPVKVTMKRHAFKFGNLVSPELWNGQMRPKSEKDDLAWKPLGEENTRNYQNIVVENFNTVVINSHAAVFRNMNLPDEKRLTVHEFWGPPWEWTTKALQDMKSKRIRLRGHAIAWTPGKLRTTMPEINKLSPQERIDWLVNDDIPARVNAFRPYLDEWVTINHPVWNPETERQKLSFSEFIAKRPEIIDWSRRIFEATRAVAPEALLTVNEGQVLASGHRLEDYHAYVKALLDAGVPVQGIGFMGHFAGSALSHPEEVYRRIDRFAEFGLPLEFTELDVNVADASQTQADYLRDMLIIAFSHPSFTGITQWGFWEGEHWIPNAALWRRDFSIKPAGEAYRQLVFKDWWTQEQLVTDAKGQAEVRGFLGEYELMAELPDGTQKRPIILEAGGTQVTFSEQ